MRFAGRFTVAGCVRSATLQVELPAWSELRQLRAWPDWKVLPVAYSRTSLRREKRALREQMRSMGLGYRAIAAEFARALQVAAPSGVAGGLRLVPARNG